MKKLICLILAFMLSIVSFAACGGSEETSSEAPKDTTSSETSAVTSQEESVEESSQELIYGTDLPVVDLGGRVIRVLTRNWAAGGGSMTYNGEIIQREEYDELTADALDRAKCEVRQLIEERYNCSIIGTFENNFDSVLANQIAAPTDEGYDIVFDGYSGAAASTLKGYYYDLNSIETIDLTNPWWDQNAVNDLSIGNKVYFTAGDINTFDNDGTFIMFFNKNALETYCPGLNLYDLVYNNEWTLDKFYEIVKGVSREYSGDTVRDEFDVWGFGTECYNILLHLIGAGQTITTKNSDDIPEFSYRNESFYTVLQDIYEIYADETNVMVANTQKYESKGYSNVWESTTIKAFREGRELFYMGGMFNIVGFRDVEGIGYLPSPKYSSDQDRYYHFISSGNASCMCIPTSVEDPDTVGLIVEALGAESKNTVTPTYIDKCLKGKDADTEDDENMLDIIFNSRCFDLGSIYNWGGIYAQLVKISATDMVSRFESIKNLADNALEDAVETILALEY